MILYLFIDIILIFLALIGGLLVGHWEGYQAGLRKREEYGPHNMVTLCRKHHEEWEKKTKRQKSRKGAK